MENFVATNGHSSSTHNANGHLNIMKFTKKPEKIAVHEDPEYTHREHEKVSTKIMTEFHNFERDGDCLTPSNSKVSLIDGKNGEKSSGSQKQPVINGNHFYESSDVNGNDSISEININGNLYLKADEDFWEVDLLESSGSIAQTTELTVDLLKSLFEDKICVLWVKNYISELVCNQLDSFLRERASDQYSHEIAKDGKFELQYFGVNRYGSPLNSAYNDNTDSKIEEYLSKALPTMRSIRKAAAPFLSPIDKFRVELDEVWPTKASVASLHGRKTFCGIGRVMPSHLSGMSADQPHFDAVPLRFFPNIRKQFTANFYLNVPDEGGELEIWNEPPIDIENWENFTIPENWRQLLPESIKVKPGQGDLLMFNTRRPHAITKFEGTNPRTSLQTFIGYTAESDVFLWV